MLVYGLDRPASQHWFTGSQQITLGRHAHCQVQLSASGGTSRHHAVMEWRAAEGRIIVSDGERGGASANGTFVQAVPITRVERDAGCVMRLGSNVVVVEIGADPGAGARASFATGKSLAMVDFLSHLDEVAQRRRPLLLTGETGVGKTHFAARIHRRSGRTGAFVAHSAANIPADSADALLFGTAAKAYTGVEAGAGLIEQAHLGTLFLDEIGDIPADLQPKLLTCVESGKVRRLRDKKERNVDVRLISATSIDLEEAIADATFREDLLYRLAATQLHLPPLRERRSEIVGLLCDFIDSARAGANPAGGAPDAAIYVDTMHHRFQPHALEAILTYDWPENIRGLANLADRLASRAEPFAIDDLTTELRDHFHTARDQAVERKRRKRAYVGPPREVIARQFVEAGHKPMALWRTHYQDEVGPEQVYRWLEQLGLRKRHKRSYGDGE